MKTLLWVSLLVLGLVLAACSVCGDVLSVNGGGTQELAVLPSEEDEGFFFGLTPAPAPLVTTPVANGQLPEEPPRGRHYGAPYDVRITVQAGHYVPGDNVSVRIYINNTGRVPDQDARVLYFLRDPHGTTWDKGAEVNLEVEPGVSIYDRTLVLPRGAVVGQWEAGVVYNVSRLDPIPATDTVYVEVGWHMNWFMAIIIGLVIVCIGAFAIGVRRGQRMAEAETDEEEDEEDEP